MLPLVLSIGFIVIVLQLNALLSLLHTISDRQLVVMQNYLESMHEIMPRRESQVGADSFDDEADEDE